MMERSTGNGPRLHCREAWDATRVAPYVEADPPGLDDRWFSLFELLTRHCQVTAF